MKSVKKLTPVSRDKSVFTPIEFNGRTTWHNLKVLRYAFFTADHEDGSKSLYVATPDGRVEEDSGSILVEKTYCPNCGKRITTMYDLPGRCICSHCGYSFTSEVIEV